jgi:hypothetical protein
MEKPGIHRCRAFLSLCDQLTFTLQAEAKAEAREPSDDNCLKAHLPSSTS